MSSCHHIACHFHKLMVPGMEKLLIPGDLCSVEVASFSAEDGVF
jgi:hypothetical protein